MEKQYLIEAAANNSSKGRVVKNSCLTQKHPRGSGRNKNLSFGAIATVMFVAIASVLLFYGCKKDTLIPNGKSNELLMQKSIGNYPQSTQIVNIETFINVDNNIYSVEGSAVVRTYDGRIYECNLTWANFAFSATLKSELYDIMIEADSIWENYIITIDILSNSYNAYVTFQAIEELWGRVIEICENNVMIIVDIDPAYYGHIHNLFLANFNAIFDETVVENRNFQTPDEVIEYCYEINLSYLQTLSATGIIDNVDRWAQELEESKYYTCTPYLYHVLSSTGTNGVTCQLNSLKNQGFIDDLEHSTLNEILNKVKQNLAGIITDTEFLVCIDNANAVYTVNYDGNSEHGKMLGIVLGIANASAEYWAERPDLINPYSFWDASLLNVIPQSP